MMRLEKCVKRVGASLADSNKSLYNPLGPYRALTSSNWRAEIDCTLREKLLVPRLATLANALLHRSAASRLTALSGSSRSTFVRTCSLVEGHIAVSLLRIRSYSR